MLAAASLVAGCTRLATDELSADEKQALPDRRVVVVRRPLPRFGLYTKTAAWAQAASAPFGLAAMGGTTAGLIAYSLTRSDPFVERYHLTDPALGLAAELGRTFGPTYGAVFAGLSTPMPGKQPAEVVAALRGSGDYSLDIATDSWGLLGSLFWGYRFTYSARFVLLDLRDGSTVASGSCRYSTPEYEDASYADFVDDDAALLRAEIKRAQASCAETFAGKILGEPGKTAGNPAVDVQGP